MDDGGIVAGPSWRWEKLLGATSSHDSMENQGFEEEQQQQGPRLEFISGADGHVYEDVVPSVEEASSRIPFAGEGLPKRATDFSGHRLDEIGLRRNLTLPFRRGAGSNPVATSRSVRANRGHEETEASSTGDIGLDGGGDDDDDAFRREIAAPQIQSAGARPNRRRRKKDCKHCRTKAAASPLDDEIAEARGESEALRAVLRRNLENEQRLAAPIGSADRSAGLAERTEVSSVFTISEKIGRPAIAESTKSAGMRVNSIYSQDRWAGKDSPIFFTDLKEPAAFQRAYSLPGRAQTPSSQNRINLRRSVRGEPPPHPARLRKHRHGWTLHLARPLDASGCSRSLVLLVIALLLLLGIAASALYIALEPQKLQIVQQYLKSSTNESSSAAPETLRPRSSDADEIPSSESPGSSSAFPVAEIKAESEGEAEGEGSSSTEIPGPVSLNSTRYCDDCLTEEVCVALVDEEVPTCRKSLDPQDPTGCAGFCLVGKQKCHRLDVDAFRCAEVEHYCLDDEWTCLNTLCIPLDKRCDGHMNCYDHSDEYNCVCDPETHFQCGNQTSCLPLETRCDGKIDCWDAADEMNCTQGRNLACPSENEFTCSNGQCIPKARFCDGLTDCLDGSDEPHGCQGRCNKHEFTCQNGRCITKGSKCNGVDDCGDGTDERHCKDRPY